MDLSAFALGSLALAGLFAAICAWRDREAQTDVAILAGSGGAFAIGCAFAVAP